MSNDLVTQSGGAVATNDLTEHFERMAAEHAATMQTGIETVSLRSGVLKVGDNQLPGNQLAAIAIADIRENTYFTAKYDPNYIVPPTCYAFGRTSADMAPDPSMQVDPSYFKPQANDCKSCVHNRWGSSDTGRGKACQNRFRLMLLPAGYYAPERAGSSNLQLHYWESLEDFQAQDMVLLKTPPTSGANWAKYVKSLFQSLKKPALQIVTRVYVTPDDNDQFHLNFEMLEELPPEMNEFLMQKYNEAMQEIRSGYLPPGTQAAQPQQGAGKLRGM